MCASADMILKVGINYFESCIFRALPSSSEARIESSIVSHSDFSLHSIFTSVCHKTSLTKATTCNISKHIRCGSFGFTKVRCKIFFCDPLFTLVILIRFFLKLKNFSRKTDFWFWLQSMAFHIAFVIQCVTGCVNQLCLQCSS
jgi:hypothetical protein